MASATYGKTVAKILAAEIDLSAVDIKCSLVDVDTYGIAITGATNATPIVVTATSHGLTSGQRVMILGVGGNTAANGIFLVAVSDANNFTLQDLNGANIAGNGAYTSGGRTIRLDVDEFHDDVTGIVATSANLTAGRTLTLGVLDFSDFSIPSVTGATTDVALFWVDTATSSTSPLLGVVTGALTPDGNNVNVTIGATGALAFC